MGNGMAAAAEIGIPYLEDEDPSQIVTKSLSNMRRILLTYV
jgi:hypothetical protein